jgi:hypothetical protein
MNDKSEVLALAKEALELFKSAKTLIEKAEKWAVEQQIQEVKPEEYCEYAWSSENPEVWPGFYATCGAHFVYEPTDRYRCKKCGKRLRRKPEPKPEFCEYICQVGEHDGLLYHRSNCEAWTLASVMAGRCYVCGKRLRRKPEPPPAPPTCEICGETLDMRGYCNNWKDQCEGRGLFFKTRALIAAGIRVSGKCRWVREDNHYWSDCGHCRYKNQGKFCCNCQREIEFTKGGTE